MSGIFPKLDSQNGLRRLWGGPNFRWNLFLLALLLAECVVFGAATLALRQWMRESGVERGGAESEPEDHVGTMLLLMAWLARHRPELLDAFLADHLLPWTPHFLGIVEAASDHPFYRGLAALTRTSLEGVRAARGLAVEEPRFYR